MRGNHRIWGRDDYTSPPAMTPEEVAIVRQCAVAPIEGLRLYRQVSIDGQLVGQVKSYAFGQFYRHHNDSEWRFVCGDWNSADPKHGRAILALLGTRG